jgi:hypothetical protein
MATCGRSNLTFNDDTKISKIFIKAAKSALFSWRQSEDGFEDLVGDLWVWYLERPGTQEKLQNADEPLARSLAYKAALQILAKNALADDKFSGKNIYSSDSVRQALRGESSNSYLMDILPMAIKALGRKNNAQAEAIKSRYVDEFVPAADSAEAAKLKRAVKSLTEHVNIIAITAGVDASRNRRTGPGSRSAVFPETRRGIGHGHADPTGDMAMMLIDHPELRDDYLAEESLRSFLGGAGYAQPA